MTADRIPCAVCGSIAIENNHDAMVEHPGDAYGLCPFVDLEVMYDEWDAIMSMINTGRYHDGHKHTWYRATNNVQDK